MTGQLNQHPLAELVREISAANLWGALRLSHERAKAVIYFEDGHIVYAASNLRPFRLSECVRRWQALTEKQLADLPERTSDLEFGMALIESGAVNNKLLEEIIERQVSELVFHAMSWVEGLWEFDSRVRLAENIRISLKTKELLLASSRRWPADFVKSRFTRREIKVLPADSSAPEDINLQPTEAFVLTRVDAPLSISELLAVSGLAETDTLRAVYTLALCGLLRLDNWPQAFTPEEIEKARSFKAAAKKSAEPKTATPQKVESKKHAPAISVPPAQSEAQAEKQDEQRDLGDLFARLSMAENYYQVLGVVSTSQAVEIKRAYHALAKRYHPDRFRKNADPSLQARVESAFAQIAQAYETLKNKQLRAVYDTKLLKQQAAMRVHRPLRTSEQSARGMKTDASTSARGSQTSKPEALPYEAEERFKQGLAALHEGNHAFAISCLGEAARMTPTDARYRAYFGRALAGDARMRRIAESEFNAAIALDARNASYRVMLAEFYYEMRLFRRAQAELERALAINPREKDARFLLQKLKSRQ